MSLDRKEVTPRMEALKRQRGR